MRSSSSILQQPLLTLPKQNTSRSGHSASAQNASSAVRFPHLPPLSGTAVPYKPGGSGSRAAPGPGPRSLRREQGPPASLPFPASAADSGALDTGAASQVWKCVWQRQHRRSGARDGLSGPRRAEEPTRETGPHPTRADGRPGLRTWENLRSGSSPALRARAAAPSGRGGPLTADR